jgi:hypothetical protein
VREALARTSKSKIAGGVRRDNWSEGWLRCSWPSSSCGIPHEMTENVAFVPISSLAVHGYDDFVACLIFESLKRSTIFCTRKDSSTKPAAITGMKTSAFVITSGSARSDQNKPAK